MNLAVRVKLLILLVAASMVSVLAFLLLSQHKAEDARQVASQQLRFYQQSLISLLSRLDQLPQLLATDPQLVHALANTHQPPVIIAANQRLADFQRITGVSDAYLLNSAGVTIAASNADLPGSFVGRRFDYRPYYQQALLGKPARFYGMGTTSHVPGYYLSYPVRSGKQIIGVAVIKTSLQPFEARMKESGRSIFVSDEHGVIVLTADAGWSYRTLQPLSPTTLQQVRDTRQYPTAQFSLWADRALSHEEWNIDSIRLQPVGKPMGQYQVLTAPAGPLGWQMVWVNPLKEATDTASQQAALIGLGLFLLGFMGIYRQERLQTLRYRKQEATRLTVAIAESTRQLASTNQELTEKIADLETTRKQWQAAQEKSVQMAKMALLGQLSSGLAHEVNQPLAALMTLADNATTLLERNMPDLAKQNLQLIADTAERMSGLTKQLKLFARQAAIAVAPMLVSESLRHASHIIAPRLQASQLSLTWSPLLDSTLVMADVNPLSQVLVNILINALDAMKQHPQPRIEITASVKDHHLQLVIRDVGTGLDERTQTHLFEPFYTTKPSGEGLGLGLVISQAIMASMNGEFTLYNHPEQGTVAALTLPLAQTLDGGN